jgi:hypothetical protein
MDRPSEEAEFTITTAIVSTFVWPSTALSDDPVVERKNP